MWKHLLTLTPRPEYFHFFNHAFTRLLLLAFVLACCGCTHQSLSSQDEFAKNSSSPVIDTVPPSVAKHRSTRQANSMTKLTPDQINKLEKILGTGKNFETQDVVILPTYVPDDFRVTYFSAWEQDLPNNPRFDGARYYILYENERGSCFSISGGVTEPIGDPPAQYEIKLNLVSPALGNFDLGITDFDRASHTSFLGFTESLNRLTRGKNSYEFKSPVYAIQNKHSYKKIHECKMIDKNDASDIVQSLDFLNP